MTETPQQITSIDSDTLLRKIAKKLREGFGPLSAGVEVFIPLAESVLRIVREHESNPAVCTCKDASGRTWWCECPVHGTRHD